jgi:hypothetical protein
VLGSSYQEGSVGIQLSRGECWDPVIKRGVLGSSYQEGVGDPVIKRGGLEIQLSRGESWDPVIKRGVLGTKWINPSTLCVPDRNKNLDFQRQGER